MSRESIVSVLGVVVAATPFLGVPGTWKQWVFVVSGTLIAIVGYRLRRAAYFRSIATPEGERRTDAFVESDGTDEHSDFVREPGERLSI